MKIINTILVVIFSVTITTNAMAVSGIGGDLGHYFDNLGFDGNVTGPSAYNGQEAGYYTGGSVFLRNQVRSVQIMSIDVPGYHSGCAGIDLFTGGFSFINKADFNKMGKAIMSSASGFALHLALKEEVPELDQVLDYLQNMAAKINNGNLSSCQLGQDLVGGLWPKNTASQGAICKAVGSQDNTFGDWAAARQGCGAGGQRESELQKAAAGKGNDAGFQDKITENTNLMWKAIRRNAFAQDNDDLAQLMMSLTGTIVFGPNNKPTYYASLASNRNLIKSLLQGGNQGPNVFIYHCSDVQKCLNITQQSLSISENKALVSQVNNIILDLVASVKNDTVLTTQEKAFLNMTTLPIYKFIIVLASLNMNAGAVGITQYSNVVAEDLLVNYLKELLNVAKQSLTGSDYTPALQKQLSDNILQAIRAVEDIQRQDYAKQNAAMMMVRNAEFLEQKVSANLASSLKDNLSFGE